jgi:Fe2+ or Zn2+ uptake regulation protein
MNSPSIADALRDHGVQPSAQRLAIAAFVLGTTAHPSADEVLEGVRQRFPMVSRATVYNTLNLFVQKGLLRSLALGEGRTVFDCNVADHHHFIDDETGAIHDIAWDALHVHDVNALTGYRVREYQVVLRGRKTRSAPRS